MEEVKKVPDEETGGGREKKCGKKRKSLTDGTGITSFSPKQRSF